MMKFMAGPLRSFTISLLLLMVASPSHAILGTAFTIGASGLGYKICISQAQTPEQKAACALMVLDPPGDNVQSIDLTLNFDHNRFEVLPNPVYFGVFSESGTQIPLELATIGGMQELNPDPGIDLLTVTQPRSGAIASFNVDNALGSATLSMDLSANPTPEESGPQNFFGFQLTSIVGAITGIEYFNTPGSYDFQLSSFACRTIDNRACGSENVITGFNVSTVSEPGTLILLSVGLLPIVVGFTHQPSKTGLRHRPTV